MIIRPEEWWSGDRLKAKVFADVRQLIFDTKTLAYQQAPRRKTEITYDVAEAVFGAAAVAIGWGEDPADWKAAAEELRRLADEMEKTGLREAPWGPNPAFDPTPVTYRAALREDDGYVLLTFPDLPELDVAAGPGEDLNSRAQLALDEGLLARLIEGAELPKSRAAGPGEVDVAASPAVGGKLLRFWAYGQRPKS